ncbi:LOW QUALITY PROTEIN: EH domain-binding protein 1-like protein 1 [Poecile atricapillus]|uniref:LOW QUALITY PROTEIN: EH domain-binding protein 1-like protein 1 n=1 Tax=Poecile atricapillus TaxID=48891 RepID=UPI002738F88B|nr:LOW QUALITY PROTEIN: EH domain-binding protein 1-like protein 1 [Poecile atricapillus]
MGSVWKRLQRAGKRAAKIRFEATLEELLVEGGGSWTPDRLTVVWSRRHRRVCSKPRRWQPGIQNPQRGMVVWVVPETLEVIVTLYRDPQAATFDDKSWNFLVVNESRGRRSVVAAAPLELGRLAGVGETPLNLTLRPRSRRVTAATLRLRLRGVVLREGHPTDVDMQSVTSLSPPGDVADLGDFESDPEDEGGAHRVGGAPPVPRAPPPRRAPPLIGDTEGPPGAGGGLGAPPRNHRGSPRGSRGAPGLVPGGHGRVPGGRGHRFRGVLEQRVGVLRPPAPAETPGNRFRRSGPPGPPGATTNGCAFDAFAALGVPRLLDPSDMETPDSLGVMTFLSQVRALLGTPPGTPPRPPERLQPGGIPRDPPGPPDVTEGEPQETAAVPRSDVTEGEPQETPAVPRSDVTEREPQETPADPRSDVTKGEPQETPADPWSDVTKGEPQETPADPPQPCRTETGAPPDPPDRIEGEPPRDPQLSPPQPPHTDTIEGGLPPPRPVEGEPPQDPPSSFGEGAAGPGAPPPPAPARGGTPTCGARGGVGTPPKRVTSGPPPAPPPSETPKEPPEPPEEESGGQWVVAELVALEQEQARLDAQAPELEQELRTLMDSGADPRREEQLLRDWFSLVQQRNLLVRRQDQLQLLAQERDLERRFELLSRELRGLLGTEEWQKPPAQRQREQLLLEELVALVNRRDRLVRDRHRRETRAQEEDEELERSLDPRRRRFGRRETCGIC